MKEPPSMSESKSQPSARSRSAWQRYWLYQLPGIVVVAALAVVAAQWLSLPPWACVLATLLWVAKDAALYPVVKLSYQTGGPTGPASLIGSLGTVRDALDPIGLIKIGPELWKAKSSSPAAAGDVVRVVGCAGMTLLVEVRTPEAEG
ncbi:MAG: hypothetical protein F4Y47_05710 [Acidobacteriia bacterium]|nr:hypothetical protein [Terriglobia bacterium]MYG04123.1 hypothetical protein [Terriglobia bacterium]MYK08253.1 hypothetical protein [Terriglobia bacterium]